MCLPLNTYLLSHAAQLAKMFTDLQVRISQQRYMSSIIGILRRNRTGLSQRALLVYCRRPVGTRAQSLGTLPNFLLGRMALSLAGQPLYIGPQEHASEGMQEASATDITVFSFTMCQCHP